MIEDIQKAGNMGKLKIFTLLFIFVSFLLVTTSWAQEPQEANWPWTKEGDNFLITTDSSDNLSPVIASACQNDSCYYFVVWSKKTSSGYDILGARVKKVGDRLDVLDKDENGIPGKPICDAKNDQMFPAVTFDGESFFVVWQDKRSGKRWEIYGRKIAFTPDSDDWQKDPEDPGDGVRISKGTNDQVSPAVASDGQNYMVVWRGKRNSKVWNIYYAMVPKTLARGEITGRTPIISTLDRDQASPAVAFNKVYLTIWQEKGAGGFWSIVGARFDPSSGFLERDLSENGIAISPTSGETSEWDRWRPDLAWHEGGRYFVIIWNSHRENDKWLIEGKRVDPYNEPPESLDEKEFTFQKDITGNKVFPAILWNDSVQDFLLVWEDSPEGEAKIFGASFQAEQMPFSESGATLISDAKDSFMPKVSSIGDEAIVIWQGIGSEGNWQIFGQRLKGQPEIPVEDAVPGIEVGQ